MCSSHRRTVSHSMRREEIWSDEEVGRKAISNDYDIVNHSGVRFFKGDQVEPSPEP